MDSTDHSLSTVNKQCQKQLDYQCREAMLFNTIQYSITRYRVTLNVVKAIWKSGKVIKGSINSEVDLA